jgi:hypothetical protein
MKPTITIIFRDGTKREFKHSTARLDSCVTITDSDGEERSFPWDLVAEVIREPQRRF